MKKKSITFNFIMNSILTLSSMIFPLISFPYVSRILQPAGTGKVAFATSVISYFSMFAMLGIPTYGIRACAKVRDNKVELSRTVQEILIINLIMGAVAYFLFFLSVFSVGQLYEEKELYLIMGASIGFNIIGVEWLYRALEQYAYITIRSLIFKAIGILLMFLLIHKTDDYVIYGGITILAGVGSGIINFIGLRRYIICRPMRKLQIKRHWKTIFIFFSMSVATTVYTNLDIIMLGFMKGDEAVGYYSAAVKIKSILVSIVTSLGTVLLPRASYYVEQGQREAFYNIASKAMKFVAFFSIPLAVYFIMFARNSIQLLSGTSFEKAIMPMQFIMPTVFVIGLTNIMGIQMLVPMGREKAVLGSECAGALLNLIMNSILIPKWGATGAAIGTLAAEAIVFCVQVILLGETVLNIYGVIKWWAIGLASICASLTVAWIKNVDLSDFFCIGLSSILFFLIYVGILLVIKEPFLDEIKKDVIKRIDFLRSHHKI